MTQKEQYRLLCEAEGSRIPLFLQHWWMDSVCLGKQWDVILALRNDGTVEGALPYLFGSRFGLRYILQPQLTQFNGPWFNLPDNLSDAARVEFENRVGKKLADQLDNLKINLFCQHFSPLVSNWLPFLWHGYSQTTRYTYRFPSLTDIDRLIANASRVRRRHLDDVSRQCSIDTRVDIHEFADFHHEYYRRRGEKDLIPKALILHLCPTAIARRQALLWGLRSHDRQLQAAWFVAFDDQCAYSLLLAIGPDAPHNAMTFLIWSVLRHLAPLTKAFDFEGSIHPGLEQFYRSFGTVQTPLFEVYKARPKFLKYLLQL